MGQDFLFGHVEPGPDFRQRSTNPVWWESRAATL